MASAMNVSEDVSHSNEDISKVLLKFEELINSPESFLEPQLKCVKSFQNIAKVLYDRLQLTHHNEKSENVLSKLLVEGFDDEQVWQQLELKNNSSVPKYLKSIGTLVSKKDLSVILNEEPESDNNDNEKEVINDDDSDKEELSPDSQSDVDSDDEIFKKIQAIRNKSDSKSKPVFNRPKGTSSMVDDQFFKLAEMEQFLIQEDKKEMKKDANKIFDDSEDDDDDDVVDYFNDITSSASSNSENELTDEDEPVKNEKSTKRATYEDFFDPPGVEDGFNSNEDGFNSNEDEDDSNNDIDDDKNYDTRDVDLDDLKENDSVKSLSNEDSDGENVDEILGAGHDRGAVKSSFEKQQEKLKEKMTELEEMNLGEKPWQLKGEISAEGRPENSLLEEYLQFDHTTRQAPVITEETTKKLEDIILQRIKDKAWDDVERKNKPKEEPFEYRRRVVLDQEKSKQSLAEIYEKEYINQQKKDAEEKEVPEHIEIAKMMDSIFGKLDALSNFHYTPKMANTEIKIISNLPAVTVEEVAPVNVSEAALLAPEEVMQKSKRDALGKTERSSTDKKRERRLKKKLQKIKQKRTEMKATNMSKPGLGNKYAKKAAKEEIKRSRGADRTMLDEKESSKKALKSSSAFFSKLQDQVKNQMREKAGLLDKRKKDKTVNASKLKL